jgi:DNA-binding LacI/PurR family transcriptional regulator
MPTRRPTSRDVAERAGVAQSTVSNVLTGKAVVSPEVRDRVMRAMEELKYRPNFAARSMRTQRTGRLAVVVSRQIYNLSHLLLGTGSAASQAGFIMEVHVVDGTDEQFSQRVIELAESGNFEGILTFQPIHKSYESLVPKDVPVVVPAQFNTDTFSTGELADPFPIVEFVERLAALGHRKFLHVAGPPQFASAAARQSAYLATIERLGLESLGVVGGAWTVEIGLEAVRALPDDAPPLAIIAANDQIAVGVMRAAYERGWRVPEDVSVTGWDNFEVSAFLTPSLTTVNIDREEFGRREMNRLISVLRNEPPAEYSTSLITTVWRESTAAPLHHD